MLLRATVVAQDDTSTERSPPDHANSPRGVARDSSGEAAPGARLGAALDHAALLGDGERLQEARFTPDGACGRDLALRRRAEGFTAEELVGALETIDQVCVKTLLRDPEGAEMKANLYACISMTIRFGIDQVLEVYEEPQGADTVRSGEPGR